ERMRGGAAGEEGPMTTVLESRGVPASASGWLPEGPGGGARGPGDTTTLVSTSALISPRPLAELVGALAAAQVLGDAGVEVSSLTYRSSESRPGALFFAVPGGRTDGHDHAGDAVRAGAVAVVVERRLPVEATQVVVPSVRAAMGPMSAVFHGRPADRMTLVGI